MSVDTRSEIREFLTSRRAKITPDQAGPTLDQPEPANAGYRAAES